MDADLDTLATALYVKIDDELKGIPRMGCPPRFTDAELVTVAVAQVLLGHDSERGWIRAARQQIGHLFPYLPDQSGYNKRLRAALPLVQRMIRLLAFDTDYWFDDHWLLDSTPVPCGASRPTAQRSDLAGWAGALKHSGAQADTTAAARLLHTVKGVAATLGADSLAAEAAHCEKQLHPGCTPADARQTVVRACAAIEAAALPLHALLQALRPAEPVPPASAGTAIDHSALRLGLRQLAELLRNSDMAALQALAGLQAEVPGALGERFQALGEAINGLDFDPALRHCTHLLEALES